MEYGDEEIRVLTEVDEVGKARRLVRLEVEDDERTVLVDETGYRARWDFKVEHPVYGRLVCSYYPDQASKQLKGYFGGGFAREKEGKRVIPGLMHWSCAQAGMEYLRAHIQQGLHDALSGLIMEAEIHGLFARNGHEFSIPNLTQRRQIKQVRDYYQARMNIRLGTRQGQRKDLNDFLGRAYRAYCLAADELNIPPTAPFTPDSTRVTEERLVEHMKRKRNRKSESGMTVRALTKQLESHELTYAELIERCRYTRWKESTGLEPENNTL